MRERRTPRETLADHDPDDADVRAEYFDGYGPVACCPKCGAGVDKLERWSEVDERRDDLYTGFHCTECGFSDGAEAW